MKTLLLTISLILFHLLGIGQTQKLTIYFNDLSTNEGKIMVLVQNDQEQDVSKLVLFINNKTAKADIYLPEGKYGIIAFHDTNGNEKLDTNFLGVPEEPYGFSNNARGLVSKPDFEETIIALDKPKQITFDLK